MRYICLDKWTNEQKWWRDIPKTNAFTDTKGAKIRLLVSNRSVMAYSIRQALIE